MAKRERNVFDPNTSRKVSGPTKELYSDFTGRIVDAIEITAAHDADHADRAGAFSDPASRRREEGQPGRNHRVHIPERPASAVVSRSVEPEGNRQHDLPSRLTT